MNVKIVADNLALSREYGDRWNKHASFNVSHWTQLDEDNEKKFRQWVVDNNAPFNPDDKFNEYDMRGFWQDQQAGNPRARSGVDQFDGKLHFTDYYKTPLHKTYSRESRGALPTAPTWDREGRYLTDNTGKVVFDSVEDAKRRKMEGY